MLPFGYVERLTWIYRLCWKLYSLLWEPMYSRRLSSIPERSEAEEEQSERKWVPKQKHEVLKAKYKCLKKLFQVYDASLINILPDSYVKPEDKHTKDTTNTSGDSHEDRKTKKKRKIRRKNSTCLNETPNLSTDTIGSEKTCSCVATAVLKDLKMKKCTLGPTLVDAVGACESNQKFSNVKSIKTESESSEMDDENLSGANARIASSVKHNCLNEMETLGMQRCKWTRVQILKYRLFGQRPKARYRMELTQQPASLSDPLFGPEAPRAQRRRLRLSRYRTRQVRSCEGMLDYDPDLQYRIQSVQQSCLLDTTPRVCPFPGCGITLNGIINYNDHLRLCHFPERKHVCNYCHDAFETEQEKISHENGHIGIFKPICSDQRCSKAALMENQQQRNRDVQCDVVSEEKLKRMVSYFDKIATGDGSFHRLGRYRNDSCVSTETQRCKPCASSDFQRCTSCSADKCCGKSLSCINMKKSEHIAIACKVCGDFFKLKNICSHMDSEHPKKTAYKSLCNIPVKDFEKDGELNVSVDSPKLRSSRSDWTVPKRDDMSKSCVSLDYDPSTNIIFYNSSSMESICKKTSVFDRIVKKVKSSKSLQNPNWEPAPKVLRI